MDGETGTFTVETAGVRTGYIETGAGVATEAVIVHATMKDLRFEDPAMEAEKAEVGDDGLLALLAFFQRSYIFVADFGMVGLGEGLGLDYRLETCDGEQTAAIAAATSANPAPVLTPSDCDILRGVGDALSGLIDPDLDLGRARAIVQQAADQLDSASGDLPSWVIDSYRLVLELVIDAREAEITSAVHIPSARQWAGLLAMQELERFGHGFESDDRCLAMGDSSDSSPTLTPDDGSRVAQGVVPTVVGMREEDARARIGDAGFTNVRVELVTDHEVEAGHVVKQTPAAGAEPGSSAQIILQVSVGPGLRQQTDSTPVERIRSAQQAAPSAYRAHSWNRDGPLVDNPDMVTFASPSGNITCHWGTFPDHAQLHCQINERNEWPQEPTEGCDHTGWAPNYIELSRDEVRDGVCTGGIYVPERAGNVLPYGFAIIDGSFGCLSEETGVTCAHMASGRGFTLARRGLDRF